MGACGFSIQLFPAWKKAWAEYEYAPGKKFTQETINALIKNCHRAWLDGCGYNAMFDPDESAMDRWEKEKAGKKVTLGPRAAPLYDIHSVRVSWGEWGPEHITVPGDACGLDIDRGFGYSPDGVALHPHNIDNMSQQILLLTIFTTIADYVVNAEIGKEFKVKLGTPKQIP